MAENMNIYVVFPHRSYVDTAFFTKRFYKKVTSLHSRYSSITNIVDIPESGKVVGLLPLNSTVIETYTFDLVGRKSQKKVVELHAESHPTQKENSPLYSYYISKNSEASSSQCCAHITYTTKTGIDHFEGIGCDAFISPQKALYRAFCNEYPVALIVYKEGKDTLLTFYNENGPIHSFFSRECHNASSLEACIQRVITAWSIDEAHIVVHGDIESNDIAIEHIRSDMSHPIEYGAYIESQSKNKKEDGFFHILSPRGMRRHINKVIVSFLCACAALFIQFGVYTHIVQASSASLHSFLAREGISLSERDGGNVIDYIEDLTYQEMSHVPRYTEIMKPFSCVDILDHISQASQKSGFVYDRIKYVLVAYPEIKGAITPYKACVVIYSSSTKDEVDLFKEELVKPSKYAIEIQESEIEGQCVCTIQ